jgi:hypothetical protein
VSGLSKNSERQQARCPFQLLIVYGTWIILEHVKKIVYAVKNVPWLILIRECGLILEYGIDYILK